MSERALCTKRKRKREGGLSSETRSASTVRVHSVECAAEQRTETESYRDTVKRGERSRGRRRREGGSRALDTPLRVDAAAPGGWPLQIRNRNTQLTCLRYIL